MVLIKFRVGWFSGFIFSTRELWKRCLYENSLFQALENFSMKNFNYENSNYFCWCVGSFVYFASLVVFVVNYFSAVVCRSLANKF